MSGKISTLILTVHDLECDICSKKIRKAIFKLQVRDQIQTFNYGVEKNTVTISGPFDPQKLKKKLWCKAGKVIKEIKVEEEEWKPPPPPPPKVHTEPEKAKPAEPEKPKPSREGTAPESATKTVVVADSLQPFRHYGSIGPAMPACCWRPCYVQCYDGCWCSSCGMYIERRTMGPSPPSGGYRGASWEEGDSCSVM